MTSPDRLLVAIHKLTRRRKVGVWQDGHTHSWTPCAGHHVELREVVRQGRPAEPDKPSIVSIDPGQPRDPEHPKAKVRQPSYIERELMPIACLEWWEREAVGRFNVGASLDLRYGWAIGRSERCEMLICAGCGAVVDEEPADDPLEMHIHTEIHPPLLVLLVTGTGDSASQGSADPGVPIDVEAIEMRARIARRLRELGHAIGYEPAKRGLARQLHGWYQALQDARAKGRVTAAFDAEALEAVEHWVEEIEAKFEPAEIREWIDPCPRCRARRIQVDGIERFAIRVNVGARRAECAACGESWEGERGIRHLRYETNLAARLKTPDQAGDARHADYEDGELPAVGSWTT